MKNLLFLFFFLTFFTAGAQDKDSAEVKNTEYEIITEDGNVIYGQIIKSDQNQLTVRTSNLGDLILARTNIKSIRPKKDSITANANPNRTRYLFAPSAHNLYKGELYYQNSYLVFNFLNYGITDNFSFGAGFEAISTLSGHPIFFLAPKTSFRIAPKLRAGFGVLYINMLAADLDFSGLGIGYGLLTYGTDDHNLTAGLGYGFVNSSFSKEPVLNLNGMTRLSKSIGLVSENWFVPADLPGYFALNSIGVRFIGQKITFDLALIRPNTGLDELLAIPYADVVIKFK